MQGVKEEELGGGEVVLVWVIWLQEAGSRPRGSLCFNCSLLAYILTPALP